MAIHIEKVNQRVQVDYVAYNTWFRRKYGYTPTNKWMQQCGTVWATTAYDDADPTWQRAYIVAADGSDHQVTMPPEFLG